MAGGNFDFLILSGQLSGLVLLPDWDVLVLSVNIFTAARLSIVHRSDQVRIPFSVQATAVNDAEAGAERHGYAICCCPGISAHEISVAATVAKYLSARLLAY